MSPPNAKIEPERLAERLAALPGIERLREAATQIPAYLVGGAVRDLLLGRERADIDVAVEGEVGELARRLGGEVRAHERFGTAAVRVEGLEVDLAATRTETYAHPGALPEVRPASLAEDLARRDFTVNAMAVPLVGDPELIDPHRGIEDLQRGELRVLHPRSFEDDPTRAVRAARYAARYGFALERSTAELISKSRPVHRFARPGGGRAPQAGRRAEGAQGVRAARRMGAARASARGPGSGGRGRRADRTRSRGSRSPLARMRCWRRCSAAGLTRRASSPRPSPRAPPRPSSCARGRSGVELALARALGAEWLDRYVAEWRGVRLEIDGRDLIAEGVAEGPALGRGLREALRAKLDGEVHGRAEELRAAVAAARENVS